MPDGRDGRVVLVVQEEIVTRLDIADEFDKAGFKVFQSGTAEEAVIVLEAEPTIRVVFTDSDLPGMMDGIKLAHYVRKRWPPTILMVSSARIPHLALPSKAFFLQRPYLKNGLANVVQEVSAQIAGSA
jgi:DNA-binding NtrC family response regulator